MIVRCRVPTVLPAVDLGDDEVLVRVGVDPLERGAVRGEIGRGLTGGAEGVVGEHGDDRGDVPGPRPPDGQLRRGRLGGGSRTAGSRGHLPHCTPRARGRGPGGHSAGRGGGERADGGGQGGEFGPGLGRGQRLLERGVVGGTCRVQQGVALFGDVGVDAAPVVGAQVAAEQPAFFQPADQAGRRALAEDDGVGELVHPEVAAVPVVLFAQDVQQGELAHAEPVCGVQRPFDVGLDPAVQRGERAPALCEAQIGVA